MNAFDAYFHAPFAAARAFLFSRLFLVLVALDTWTLMIGHAGRYGVDGFNVAHFGWLDMLMPTPSAALYVGVLIATGLLALAAALSGPRRPALVALFLLYTFSWAMSMLDSYQHHYFVSSVLLCLVFFPQLRAADVHAPKPPAAAADGNKKTTKKKTAPEPDLAPAPATAQGFGVNLLCATAGILYTYTAIAKLDVQWRDGHTLTRISAAKRVYAPLAELAAKLGMSDAAFWSAFSTSVIPIEFTIALTYFTAVTADANRARWQRNLALLGWLLAMTLHVGAEAMELEIGWFSYYMMLFASTFLLPARAVDRLARALTWPAELLTRELADLLEPKTTAGAGRITLTLAAAAAITLGAVGKLLDLPGAFPACLWAAGLCFGLSAWLVQRGRAAELRPLLLGSGLAAVLMWLAIANSETRWDFYRFLGGDLKRRGEPEAALEAYERGERYAPKGESRKDQILDLRRKLGR
ncbi:MAG TPA: HTTM domain-containing protein [Polyangiales bacterium]|nr:HTTM domain-containing protein [Polyangiales bacterium]